MKNRLLPDLVLLLIFFLIGMMLGVGLCQGDELACKDGQCPSEETKSRSHPSIVRLIHTDQTGAGFFTGTLIEIEHAGSLILTCAHALEFAGNTMVIYDNGQKEWASIIEKDHDLDLALLQVKQNDRKKFPIASVVPSRGEWVAGFGCGFGGFKESQGKVKGYLWLSPPESMAVPMEGFSFAVGVRQGDSGGPVLNSSGELAGVIFGGDENETSAVDCKVVNAFIKRALGQVTVKGTSDPQSPPADVLVSEPALTKPGATLLNPLPWLPVVHAKPTLQQTTNPEKEKSENSTKGQKAPSSGLGLPGIPNEIDWFSLAVLGGKVAAGSAGLTLTGGSAWAAWLAMQGAIRLYKRRKKRKRDQIAEAAVLAAAPGGISAIKAADNFLGIARDDEEAKQLLQLSQLEGRSPVHDAIVGRFAFDILDRIIEHHPDGPEAGFARSIRSQLEDRFNQVAPAAVLKEEKGN